MGNNLGDLVSNASELSRIAIRQISAIRSYTATFPAVKDSFNPIQKQEFNPVFSPSIVVAPHPSPTPPPVSVTPPNKDSSKWDVRFLSARPVNIAASQDDEVGLVIFREVNHYTGFAGIVACFRNEAIYGKRSYNAENVTAHLVMKNRSGQEIGVGISRGCWLNTPNDMIDIDVSESQCVVLALVHAKPNEQAAAVFIPCKKRANSVYGDSVTDEAIDIDPEQIAAIEIRLLNSWKFLLLEPTTVNFAIKDGRPLVVRQPS